MNTRVHPGDLLAAAVNVGLGVDQRVVLRGVDNVGHDESSEEV